MLHDWRYFSRTPDLTGLSAFECGSYQSLGRQVTGKTVVVPQHRSTSRKVLVPCELSIEAAAVCRASPSLYHQTLRASSPSRSENDCDDVRFSGWSIPLSLTILQQRYHAELRWQLDTPSREDLTMKL